MDKPIVNKLPESSETAGFVERNDLRGRAYFQEAGGIIEELKERGIKTVRLSFADQHGWLRSKSVVSNAIESVFRNGVSMPTSLLAKDTADNNVTSWFKAGAVFGIPEMDGAGDMVMVPIPSTFRILPWTDQNVGGPAAWMLCDLFFTNGKPVPFSTRNVLRDALRRLKKHGFNYTAGLEIEFHLFKLVDPLNKPEHATPPSTPPQVNLLSHGYRYLSENCYDELDALFQVIRENLEALELPVRTMEAEYGPSQLELTLQPASGIAAADNMILLRGAIKQICRRSGYHATFMCRPGLPNMCSSGWHLHQSLTNVDTDENAFIPTADKDLLSSVGRHFAAGILKHAHSASLFSTPTINGYKRYRPYSLAPDRICWSRDNRAAMLRIVGGPGDKATRIENRVGEPMANPYLYFASQIYSGLDGVLNALEPPPPSDSPYLEDLPRLPVSLMDAVEKLEADEFWKAKMPRGFVDYLLSIKKSEISRFLLTVTDWEHREYFGNF